LHSYYAYGVGIDSELPLPELATSPPAVPSVASIRVGRIETPPPNIPDSSHSVSPCEVVLAYSGVGRFRVTDGREILVEPEPDAEPSLLRVCLLGPAMAVLLHQREQLVLHASAVRLGEGVSIFLGGKGWGKSTLAACLDARGQGLVADDIVAVQTTDDGDARVYPGFPRLKLWPGAAGFLGWDPDSLPRLTSELEKRHAPAQGPFSLASRPLRRIYVLEFGDRVEIEPIQPREAMLEMVRHSYLLRFLPASGTSVPHFRQCRALVQSIGLTRLKRPVRMDLLPHIADLLQEHGARG
jgi:hypothetical protein